MGGKLIFIEINMAFTRWGYSFEGAFLNCDSLKNLPGIYVIWCKSGENWKVLDVGESENVKERVCNHDRQDCWARNCNGTIYYSAVYFPDSSAEQRRVVESEIRTTTKPPCGDR